MAQRPAKAPKKAVSPAVAVIVIVVVLVIVVIAYVKLGKSKQGMEKTPELQKIQSELNASVRRVDPSKTRMGGGGRARAAGQTMPQAPVGR